MGDFETAREHVRKAYKIELSEKPCVVEFVESFGGFIVGTYDLLPTIDSAKIKFSGLSDEELSSKYESINQRIGSLNFLCSSTSTDSTDFSLQETFQCQHGGVFDVSILDGSIYVAHANGFIARYEFIDKKFKYCESIKVTDVQSTLLTSIDTCNRPDGSGLVVVGDSKGCVTIVASNSDDAKLGNILSKCTVTEYADPVWQVKFLPSNNLNANQLPILVTAENSSWYIYKFNAQPADSCFQLLHTNRDFEAGVTSICLLPRSVHNSDTEVMKLTLGSYDESIRIYEIKLSENCELTDIKCSLDSPLVIDGGGIWRLNCVQDRVLYIAAMYAGTYKINLDNLCDTDNRAKLQKVELDEPECSNDNKSAPLYYGVDYSPKDSIVCIVDYNNNCCIFVDQLEQI